MVAAHYAAREKLAGNDYMKTTRSETVRLAPFPDLVYVRRPTDDGIVGLGETFFGAQAVEPYLHEIAAPRVLGVDPLPIERIASILGSYVGYTNGGLYPVGG
jgi:L-alanine-DL-glutamate epimerase-like enolase superfamily enzyme